MKLERKPKSATLTLHAGGFQFELPRATVDVALHEPTIQRFGNFQFEPLTLKDKMILKGKTSPTKPHRLSANDGWISIMEKGGSIVTDLDAGQNKPVKNLVNIMADYGNRFRPNSKENEGSKIEIDSGGSLNMHFPNGHFVSYSIGQGHSKSAESSSGNAEASTMQLQDLVKRGIYKVASQKVKVSVKTHGKDGKPLTTHRIVDSKGLADLLKKYSG